MIRRLLLTSFAIALFAVVPAYAGASESMAVEEMPEEILPHKQQILAIIGDLSPYATNIAYFYNTPVNILQLKSEVKRIQKEMK